MGYKDDKRFFSKPTPVGIEKIGAELGEDTSIWMEKIKNEFSKDYPDLVTRSKPHFGFTHKDFAQGAGTGSVTITAGNRILLFPLIVRDRDLAPFDTFYDQNDKSFKYVTENVKKELINAYNPYKGLSKDDLSEFDQVGSTDKREFASWRDPAKIAELDYSRFEKLADYLSDNVEEFMLAPQNYIDTVKLATSLLMRQRSMVQMTKHANDMRYVPGKYDAYDVALIKKEDIDNYSVKLGSYGNRNIEEILLSSFGVKKLAAEFGKTSDKILDGTDNGDGALVTRGEEIPTRIVDNNLTDVITPRPGMIRTYGTYEVTLSTGNTEIGVAYPVISWDGEDTGKLLFAGNNSYSVTGPFSGRMVSTHMVLPTGNLSEGVKGFFVKNAEGQAFCTNPFRIDRIDSDDNYPLHLYATDLTNMSSVHLILTKAYGRPARINPDISPELIDHNGGNYFIPHNMRFTPLPEVQVKILSSEESGVKVAADKKESEHAGSIIEVTKTASRYSVYQKKSILSGNGIRDYESCDLLKTAFILSVCGCAPDMTDLVKMGTGETATVFVPIDAIITRRIREVSTSAELIKSASINAYIDGGFAANIEPLIPSIGDIAKISMVLARINVDDYMPLVTRVKGTGVSLDKTAEDSGGESLNKIFNLNFLSKENVGYFIEHLSSLETVEDVLTRLLIVARIGDIGLDPSMVEATLKGIAEIKERFSKAEVIARGR